MRRAARCCLLRLLIDGCGVVDAAVGDKSGASLHAAAEREDIACGFARDIGDRVPERDDGDSRAVVDPGHGIPCGVGGRDRRAAPAAHGDAGVVDWNVNTPELSVTAAAGVACVRRTTLTESPTQNARTTTATRFRMHA